MTGRSPAFTLIELLIAVTIFSVIAVSVYSVFSTGVRLWDRANPMIEANQSVRFFLNSLSSDLKNSVRYLPDGANFEGGSKAVSFMALVSGQGGPTSHGTELARISYYYDASRKAIMRSAATLSEGFSPDLAKTSEILDMPDGPSFSLEYCYKRPISPTTYEYDWKDEWLKKDMDAGKIPRGVRITVPGYSKTILIPTGTLGDENAS